MQEYLGVKSVKQLGRVLKCTNPSSFESLKSATQSDEIIVMLANNCIQTVAPIISDEQKHKEHWGRYSVYGDYMFFIFMALKESDIGKCTDQEWEVEFEGIQGLRR